MNISPYTPEHETAILDAIKQDPNWAIFTKEDAIELYRKALQQSITYVCHQNDEFCGYVRAFDDLGLAIYVSELYVLPQWRNQHVGRSLLARYKTDFPDKTVYALSDEDAYYEKIGYTKIGSVFEL